MNAGNADVNAGNAGVNAGNAGVLVRIEREARKNLRLCRSTLRKGYAFPASLFLRNLEAAPQHSAAKPQTQSRRKR